MKRRLVVALGLQGLFVAGAFAGACGGSSSDGGSTGSAAGSAAGGTSTGSSTGSASSGGASGGVATTGTTPTTGSTAGAATGASTGSTTGSTTGAGSGSSGSPGLGDASTGASGGGGASAGSSGSFVGNDAAPPSGDGGLAGAAPLTGLLGSATAPLLTPAQAAEFTKANYFAQTGTLGSLTTDNWNPTGLDVTSFTAKYTVAKTGGMFATVQGAIDAALTAGGTTRVYIQIAPGTYDEQVCIKASTTPITIYSTNADATQTIIQHADFQGGLATMGTNACGGDTNQQASTLSAVGNGFQAKNLTIQNTVTTAQIAGSAASQAVALATQGDQVILDNVRVLSHQDTLYIDGPKGVVTRVYLKNSYVAGDVDFIFGAATAVLEGCTITFVSDRKGSGQPLAPDTDSRNAYGFLVINSNFTADANTAMGVIGLGRAWDHNCKLGYPAMCGAIVPNGQATVMNSMIDAHYSKTTPWAPAATTSRAYTSTGCGNATCPAFRLYEYNNSGPGAP